MVNGDQWLRLCACTFYSGLFLYRSPRINNNVKWLEVLAVLCWQRSVQFGRFLSPWPIVTLIIHNVSFCIFNIIVNSSLEYFSLVLNTILRKTMLNDMISCINKDWWWWWSVYPNFDHFSKKLFFAFSDRSYYNLSVKNKFYEKRLIPSKVIDSKRFFP